jgi:hypothetical protein
MSGPYGAEPRPANKRMSGCVVAILVFAGLVVIVLSVGASCLWRVSKTPAAARAAKIVGDTAQMMWRAQKAPGAAEVRKQGPCEEAFVISAEDMVKLAADLRDGSAPHGHALVSCQVSFLRTAPTCDRIAGIYVDVAHPAGSFDVIVKKQGSVRDECKTRFDRDGAPLE